ncbi:MAG: hypothetical protein HYY00_06940 [Chloroflexi bacterium]|nr:hypothetical protein [Chloroflexota bacterium]
MDDILSELSKKAGKSADNLTARVVLLIRLNTLVERRLIERRRIGGTDYFATPKRQ